MNDYEIDTFEVNGFKVTIGYDLTAESPHDWELRGADLTMWGRHWDFPNDAGIDMDNFYGWGDVADRLLHPKRNRDERGRFAKGYESVRALVLLPVYVYDHSGISLQAGSRTYPFSDRWDSAQCGVAYVTPENWKQLSDKPWTGNDAQVDRAEREIKSLVRDYGRYCNGDVYSFAIEDFDGEYVESCGGFYDYDECEKEARWTAEHTEHEPKCTGTLERPSGLIIHDRECAIHTEPGPGYALAPVE